MLVEAGGERLLAIFGPRECGDRERRDPTLRIACAHLAHQRVTVLARQADVADDEARPAYLDGVARLGGRFDRADFRATLLQELAHDVARIGFVFDEQDVDVVEAGLARSSARISPVSSTPVDTGSGSSTRNVEPWPSPSLETEIVAAVQLDDLLGDGEAEPEPAMGARGATSAWRKRSNTCGRNSRLMPTPVSATSMVTMAPSRCARTLTLPP